MALKKEKIDLWYQSINRQPLPYYVLSTRSFRPSSQRAISHNPVYIPTTMSYSDTSNTHTGRETMCRVLNMRFWGHQNEVQKVDFIDLWWCVVFFVRGRRLIWQSFLASHRPQSPDYLTHPLRALRANKTAWPVLSLCLLPFYLSSSCFQPYNTVLLP
jgi:hypothetical protein